MTDIVDIKAISARAGANQLNPLPQPAT